MLNSNKDTFIVFDTETTGFEPELGHKIIEIGAVKVVGGEIVDEKFHEYVDPEREIPEGAVKVHGMVREDCIELGKGKVFADIADDIIHFFEGSIAVAHNAPFDTGFLDFELEKVGRKKFTDICTVIDSLGYANGISPTKKNNLDSLAKRYGINDFDRSFHGALLDSIILAKTFMAMRRSQEHLSMSDVLNSTQAKRKVFNLSDIVKPIPANLSASLPTATLSEDEQERHNDYLSGIDEGLSW